MAKKTRREKELSRLRRESEMLKAQAKRNGPGQEKISKGSRIEEPLQTPQVDTRHLKADLVKTAVLTTIAFAVISLVYIFRSQIPYL